MKTIVAYMLAAAFAALPAAAKHASAPDTASGAAGTVQAESKSGGQESLAASGRNRSLERAKQVLHYVNIERKKRGKKPLRISDRCQRKAEARANEICRRFNHKGAFGGLGCYRWKGENIARGQKSPRAVVRAWMRSIGHRKNMLSGKFDFMGIGYCRGRWVQTLGGGKTVVYGRNKPKKTVHRRPKKKKVKVRR